ncbi:ImmA/IrrE family metallo-endopeptidase [uncultured Streptococcus sp.]|uniref:ImmA/IrrE family metallo-endopeptidase n=1 Tax=uncultured Streptococcus sp. TaxID=83427 RepID=UPI00204AB7D0|nr:ImmA/IrrE family metallo-endopeptidase [uncultured Streptococcus sp.]DAF29785.1 MAG TPA: IrrE protein [Caudoviricetes sp.]
MVRLEEIYPAWFLEQFGQYKEAVSNIELDSLTSAISVDKIIKTVGLSLKNTLLETHSGQVDSGDKVIFVNSREPLVRQRFTKAHELGHYVLGHEGVSNRLVDTSDYTFFDRLKERAANSFAAELLMPKKLIKNVIDKYLKETGMTSEELKYSSINDFVSYLSETLEVSKESMEYRLLNLGIIKDV